MRRELALWAAASGVVALLPIAIGGDRYLMQLANVMLVFVALAVSWDVVARTGQLSLAHGAFFGVGAYSVALAHKYATLPPLLGIVLAGVIGLAIALALGAVTLRLRGIYFAIATLAFGEVLRTVALQMQDVTGGTIGISMPPLFGGDRVASYYLIGAIALLAIALSLGVRYTRWHYAVTALRTNEAVAAAMGVPVVRAKVLAFTSSAVVATLAGAYYMPFITHTDPNDAFEVSRSVAALAFPIFGGIYTTVGPVVGTLVLRSLEEYLRVTPPWKEGYQVVYGAVIVLAVLFMPRGLVSVADKVLGRGSRMRLGAIRRFRRAP